MKKIIACFMTLLSLSLSQASASSFRLDYNKMVILDAEDLAETGIKAAYGKLKPLLKLHVKKPEQITEKFNRDLPSYSVICAGTIYDIYSPALLSVHGESWARATFVFFTIINNQLKGAPVKFYAINGGNDLGGMFLTEQQVFAAKKSLKNKADWPYIPTLEHPWYGQYHQ
jgi:hypothetical protein